MFRLQWVLAACGLLVMAMPPTRAEVPGIIFDSDMSSDHDDAADMAVLQALADLGECKILACMASSQNGGTALCMSSMNNYFGRPEIPCGRRPDAGGPGAYPGQVAAEFPHPLYSTYTDPPLAVNLYRKILAAQPDHSVTIVTTGYLNNLEDLMKSGPDQDSPLNGMDLIRKKVKLLACAGGAYPSGDEFNFRVEAAAAHYVINQWPVAAMFDGYDVGQDIYSGGMLESTPKTNPIRRAFELSFFGPYPTWGQLMIYYAVRTEESQKLWNYQMTGRNHVDEQGHNVWTGASGPTGAEEQGYMIEIQRYPIQQAVDTLVMNSGAPKSQGTKYPPNQPSNLRATIEGKTIHLQWTDNSWNETGFKIERKIDGLFKEIGSVAANVTAFTDKDLATTANVAYRVKSYNAIGDSGTNPINSIVGSGAFPVGPAGYATVTVFSGGWTELNLTKPDDKSPIYHCYQYDNLNWARGPQVCDHIVVNNDSATGQDVTINVMVGAKGGYGRYYVYFLYQDEKNWYRVNTGSSGQGPANYTSRFEKCVNGTITPIGEPGEGVNLNNGCLMQTWQVVISQAGIMKFLTNNNPKGNALPRLHQVLNVTEASFSFTGGKIALGTDIGQPVWDHFNFDTTAAK